MGDKKRKSSYEVVTRLASVANIGDGLDMDIRIMVKDDEFYVDIRKVRRSEGKKDYYLYNQGITLPLSNMDYIHDAMAVVNDAVKSLSEEN